MRAVEMAQRRWNVKIVVADLVQEVKDALESSAEWVTGEDEPTGRPLLTVIPGGMQ